DLQRFLADVPVQACPPSTWYRLRKLLRRHKGPMLAACLVALALVGGMIATTCSMLRATDAERRALNEANQKAKALRDKQRALEAAQVSERASERQLWKAMMAQARANGLSRRAGQRFETLALLRQATALARTLKLPDENFHELRNAVTTTLALP